MEAIWVTGSKSLIASYSHWAENTLEMKEAVLFEIFQWELSQSILLDLKPSRDREHKRKEPSIWGPLVVQGTFTKCFHLILGHQFSLAKPSFGAE